MELQFDATDVQPLASQDVLPKGRYLAEITDSEMKDTKSGSGQYLQLEFTVIDGEFSGRKQWVRLNLVNANETAVSIAKAELSAICHCIGVLRVEDSIDLHGRPLYIDVTVEKRKDNGEDSNRIKGYAATEGGSKPAPPAPKAAPASAKAAPPWAKSKAA